MKTKRISAFKWLPVLALGIFTATPPILRADVAWTNSAGDLLWSTAANWTPNQVPTDLDGLTFDNVPVGGPTNVQGNVNNIVDNSISVGALRYYPIGPNTHTTLLKPGVTVWSITNATGQTSPSMSLSTPTTTDVGYVTIIGPEAKLICGSVDSPFVDAGGGMYLEVWYARTAAGAQKATLDMAALDDFTYAGGIIRIGCSASGNTTRLGPKGTLILARTNLIIAATKPADTGQLYAGTLVGAHTGTASTGAAGEIQLGVKNTLRTDYMILGAYNNNAGTMKFQAGVMGANPTLTMRTINGTDRMDRLGIGDSSDQTIDINGTGTGTMDLTGGAVDILVNNLNVGRNMGAGNTTRRGTGNGTLTWTAGPIDVTTLFIGAQGADNAGSATGVVNVRTNAVLLASSVSIGVDAGARTGTGNGTLNIAHGGAATVANNITDGTSGTSTMNITNGTLTVGGLVRADNLTAISSVLNLTVSPTISAGNPVCSVANLTLGTSVTFNLSGTGLTLAKYPLIKYTGSIGGGASLVLSTQPLGTSGYLTNNTATSSIDLVVTNVPAVKWNGNVNGNWDINGTTNWINTVSSAAVTYQEPSVPGDPVIFNDTATGTKTVTLTTTLSPKSVVVNNIAPYSFIGTGGISGPTDLYKSGSGTLELANIGANDYSGGTTVGEGKLLVNGSLSGGGTVTVQSGATLGGTGAISGPVTIASAGTLAAGSSIGTLSFNSSLVMSAGSSNVFEVNSDTLAHDQVAGSGGVTYGGNLVISFSGGNTALTNGAEIQLFNPTGSGTFDAIVPAYPGAGLAWDTSTLAFDGTLRILSFPLGNQLSWTNVTGGDLLWSNPANWVRNTPAFPGSPAPNSVPTADDDVDFGTLGDGAFGATNVQEAVNNIVSASTAIGSLRYHPISPSFHTTLLQPGVTLWSNTNTVAGNTSPNMAGTTGTSDIGYATILGTNATLICGNVETPVVMPSGGCFLEVYYMRSATGTQRATLDMGGLDNFVFGGGVVRVGSVASGNSTRGGARGTLILAKTNFLLAATPKGGYPTDPQPIGFIGGFNVGARTSTLNSSDYGELQLGVTNAIWSDHIKIGSYSSSTGLVFFQASALASNPSLYLRNTNGTDRVSHLGIGDSSEQTADISNPTSLGIVDLTGGTVNALVANLGVGRNMGSGTTSRRGGGAGSLTWTAGQFDVTDLSIGAQVADNRGNALGVVNVLSNASLVVGTTINIGSDLGGASGIANGTLNIAHGGQVTVTSDVVETSSGADGTSAINITNGTLTVGGVITVDTLNVNSGTVFNTGPITAGTLMGNGTIVGPVTVLTSLAPGSSIGTLSVSNSLVLSSGSSNVFEVNLGNLSHDRVIGLTSINYDGALAVVNIGGTSAATNGAVIKIFDAATYTGTFTATDLPPPAPGLAWDTSGLTNGTIMIVQGVSTTPTNLTISVIGNALDISWPADHIGWRLEGQTNSLNVGISNNWFTVPASASTNHVIMTIDSANGATFYRLVYP